MFQKSEKFQIPKHHWTPMFHGKDEAVSQEAAFFIQVHFHSAPLTIPLSHPVPSSSST